MVPSAVTVVVAACLLVSCSTKQPPNEGAEPGHAVSGSRTPAGEDTDLSLAATPGPTPAVTLADLPTAPARSAAVLARQLNRATTTLRDTDAPAADVRRAARFQQLAVRALATASVAFRRNVTTRLRPFTARVTRSMVRAVRLLHAMTEPQKELPRWRIVSPPPASELLGYYKEAKRRIGVPWTYLAAIHLVETRMGRIRGVSTAGARGPMQFLPSTWELYGAGGDINDPRDAILAAARLLRDHGAPGDMSRALWHYNPSHNYVRAVTAHARTLQRWPDGYRGYWHWRVLYRHVRGTYLLPLGYPKTPPVLLRGR